MRVSGEGSYPSRGGTALPRWIHEKTGRSFAGSLQGKRFRFTVVVSRFNLSITQRLLLGALDGLGKCGVRPDRITVIWTPGALELPQAAMKAAHGRKPLPDAIVCLGAVLRGETTHFDHVCAEAAHGIRSVAMKTGIPVAFGVLTTDTVKQALARAGGKKGNKGWDAAMTAVSMANLFSRMDRG